MYRRFVLSVDWMCVSCFEISLKLWMTGKYKVCSHSKCWMWLWQGSQWTRWQVLYCEPARTGRACCKVFPLQIMMIPPSSLPSPPSPSCWFIDYLVSVETINAGPDVRWFVSKLCCRSPVVVTPVLSDGAEAHLMSLGESRHSDMMQFYRPL